MLSTFRHICLYWAGVPALPLSPGQFDPPDTSFCGSTQIVRKSLCGAIALMLSATCLIFALIAASPPSACAQVAAGFQLTSR